MNFKVGDKVLHYYANHGICTIERIGYGRIKVSGTAYTIYLKDETGYRFNCDDQFVRLADPSIEQREAIQVLGEDYF